MRYKLYELYKLYGNVYILTDTSCTVLDSAESLFRLHSSPPLSVIDIISYFQLLYTRILN